jgi:hypothetical protein
LICSRTNSSASKSAIQFPFSTHLSLVLDTKGAPFAEYF